MLPAWPQGDADVAFELMAATPKTVIFGSNGSMGAVTRFGAATATPEAAGTRVPVVAGHGAPATPNAINGTVAVVGVPELPPARTKPDAENVYGELSAGLGAEVTVNVTMTGGGLSGLDPLGAHDGTHCGVTAVILVPSVTELVVSAPAGTRLCEQ